MKDLTAFELSREHDEEHLTGLEDVDLNSHLDVFNAILKQVRTATSPLTYSLVYPVKSHNCLLSIKSLRCFGIICKISLSCNLSYLGKYVKSREFLKRLRKWSDRNFTPRF